VAPDITTVQQAEADAPIARLTLREAMQGQIQAVAVAVDLITMQTIKEVMVDQQSESRLENLSAKL
jgi:hypothetical protein